MLGGGDNDSPAAASVLSMFGTSKFTSPAKSKDFSFSFGGPSETPTATSQEFSFSFGGSNGTEDRPSSMFSLF